MAKALLIIWLALGGAFAACSMAGEVLYAYAGKIVYLHPHDAMPWFQLGARTAPWIHYIRTAPEYLAGIDPTITDEEAIEIMEEGLYYDPYDVQTMLLLSMRYKHNKQDTQARKVLEKINSIWPNSPPVKFLERVGIGHDKASR